MVDGSEVAGMIAEEMGSMKKWAPKPHVNIFDLIGASASDEKIKDRIFGQRIYYTEVSPELSELRK